MGTSAMSATSERFAKALDELQLWVSQGLRPAFEDLTACLGAFRRLQQEAQRVVEATALLGIAPDAASWSNVLEFLQAVKHLEAALVG
jgi:hypothetical protein